MVTYRWMAAEGEEDGCPVMYRGRQIPNAAISDPSLGMLVVVTLSYPIGNSTKLPSPSQYQEIDDFESSWIDQLEENRECLLAFVRTFGGRVKYFLYARDAEHIAMVVNATWHGMNVTVEAKPDPSWAEYREFLAGLDGYSSRDEV